MKYKYTNTKTHKLSWQEEMTQMTPRFAQQQTPKRTETAVKRRNPIQKTVVENGKHEEKRETEFGVGGFNQTGVGGFNQAVFWKDPLPEISCKDIDLLSGDSAETSDEDLEEVKLKREEEYRKVDNEVEEEEEEERPVLFITRKTAVSVNSGITLLEKKTRSVGKEAEQVADRVRRLQERLARLEG